MDFSILLRTQLCKSTIIEGKTEVVFIKNYTLSDSVFKKKVIRYVLCIILKNYLGKNYCTGFMPYHGR